MTDAAFKAEFSDFKLVKTRSTAQIVLELPIEQADAALKALGGVPKPGVTVWVAVAVMSKTAISEPVEKPKRSWDEIPPPEQIGIRINDPQFQKWLAGYWDMPLPTTGHETTQTDARIKAHLQIESKTEAVSGTIAAYAWEALDQEYQDSCGLIAQRAT